MSQLVALVKERALPPQLGARAPQLVGLTELDTSCLAGDAHRHGLLMRAWTVEVGADTCKSPVATATTRAEAAVTGTHAAEIGLMTLLEELSGAEAGSQEQEPGNPLADAFGSTLLDLGTRRGRFQKPS